MKQGPSLSAFEPNELERQLLEAGRADRIPIQLQLQMGEALLASPQPSAATLGAPTKLAALLFSKSGVWGALSVVALAAGIGFSALHASTLGLVAKSRLPVVAGDQPGVSAAGSELPAAASGERSAAPAESPLPAQAKLAATLPLSEELALLDRTREALRDHKPARALTLLERHARRFSNGALGPEADVLRIEAWRSSGERERAEQAARQFLEHHPAHPLASHVATLTRQPVH